MREIERRLSTIELLMAPGAFSEPPPSIRVTVYGRPTKPVRGIYNCPASITEQFKPEPPLVELNLKPKKPPRKRKPKLTVIEG